MGYSTRTDVEFWGQFNSSDFGSIAYSYESSLQRAIDTADRYIDDYCNVPEGFFSAGGVEIQQEYLNGSDVKYIGGVVKFFSWYYGGTSHLKFKHHPVLSVTKLEEETSADTWTQRTEGTGNDYIVVEDGVRFIRNTPGWKYKNVRVTYKVGYARTPSQISEVSGRLAAAVLRRIKTASNPVSVTIQGQSVSVAADASLGKPVLTDDLKKLLENYKRAVYGFS